jgi:hypothetical protein
MNLKSQGLEEVVAARSAKNGKSPRHDRTKRKALGNARAFCCVPSMNDSLEVEVLDPA